MLSDFDITCGRPYSCLYTYFVQIYIRCLLDVLLYRFIVLFVHIRCDDDDKGEFYTHSFLFEQLKQILQAHTELAVEAFLKASQQGS